MTDIVERLRDRAGPPTQAPYADGTLWREAADEIERLRGECEERARLNGVGGELALALHAEIERLRSRDDIWALREATNEIERLRAEIKRLDP
jgi:hypothetical protein